MPTFLWAFLFYRMALTSRFTVTVPESSVQSLNAVWTTAVAALLCFEEVQIKFHQ